MERIAIEFYGEVAWAETRGPVTGYWADENDPDPEPDEYACAYCGEELAGWDAACPVCAALARAEE